MTIALKIGNEDSQIQGFIYLDAVTRYDKDLSGKVTSFPVDSGANISDHFISNNTKFTIEGVISDIDITGISDLVKIGNQKPINAKVKPDAAQVEESEGGLLSFLPSVVNQFFKKDPATVYVDKRQPSTIPTIELLLSELMAGIYYNSADNRWRNKMTPTVIYEMSGSNFVNAHTNLIITNVAFSEDADSGSALRISLTLEKVRFVTLEMTEVGRVARTTVQKKTSGTKNKGTPATPTGTAALSSSNPALYAVNNKKNDPLAPKENLSKYINPTQTFQQNLYGLTGG